MRYRVHIEMSRDGYPLRLQTALLVGGSSQGVAKARAQELAREQHSECDDFRVYHVEELGKCKKDTVKDWERATLLCDQIRIDADAALAVVNDLPSGMAEDAANLLCEALTEARAQVLAWANDHGEP